MRQVHLAGEKMFVDFAGRTAEVVDINTGEIVPVQIFVAVLGASSFTYTEAVWSQKLPDWLNTHSPASLYEAFAPQEAKRLADRLEIHHTPKHGWWLNMAEIELSALGRDLPDRVGDRVTLERHVQAWRHRRNAAATRADWQFTTKDARIKLRKLYPTMES